MRLLAIETATEACSVALFEDERLLANFHEILGRGHAERLVPMLSELPGRGRATRIRVSLGPGSFTGVRIGLAVARALGIAWQAEVLGYPTLALIARMESRTGERARTQVSGDRLVCMNGGHGEWFVQPFSSAGSSLGPCRSLDPETAVASYAETVVIGSRATEFVALRGYGAAHQLLPDATAVADLASDQLTERLSPLYGREPDAKLPDR